MTSSYLTSPAEAETAIARLLKEEFSKPNGTCSISIRDDCAFDKPEWLHLGCLRFPPLHRESVEVTEVDAWQNIVRLGAFEWHVSTESDVEHALTKLLGHDKDDVKFPLGTLLRDISSIAVRTGLLLPTFDSAALDTMPYRRSTTVVSDTSGVVQGGLDFVARHLHPAARIKVPAIVHMELVGSSDNFFKLRRATKTKNATRRRRELAEHLKSQGGQRTLLRLELHADTEIERTFLFGDPLREAFGTDNDGDVSGLNISLPIRSYADRLIVEAARQHQAHSGPGHAVQLLTSDQGLARMAMAEGISPLYFETITASRFFGTCVTGRTFDPFSGIVRGISLALVLWEFATAFGSVRLDGAETMASFSVSALGGNMAWSPYHSLEDLLWCTSTIPTEEPYGQSEGPQEPLEPLEPANSQAVRQAGRQHETQNKPATYFRFDVEKLLRLVCILDDKQEMDEGAVAGIIQTKHVRGREEYRRFLLSGNFIADSPGSWRSQPRLVSLSAALRNENVETIRELLLETPSFLNFVELLRAKELAQPLDRTFAGRSSSTYRTLGEVTQLCTEIRGKGIFPTLSVPNADEFSGMAMQRFLELDEGDGLVATGAWLEALVQKDGIHPEVARLLLEEARRKRMLRRSTEGSTMQMRFRTHVVHVLRFESGAPRVVPVHLYRGDYLIPGKSSASLRVEALEQ